MAAQYSQYSHYNGLLYRLHSHWYLWTVSNYMLIISHRDVNHTNTGTFSTKHANIYENCWRRKKRNVFCAKRSLSYAPIRWQVRHSVRHASSRGSARIQIINLPCIFDFFFFGWFHSVWDIACYKIMLFFYHQDAVLSVICSITDTNNSSPSRDET